MVIPVFPRLIHPSPVKAPYSSANSGVVFMLQKKEKPAKNVCTHVIAGESKLISLKSLHAQNPKKLLHYTPISSARTSATSFGSTQKSGSRFDSTFFGRVFTFSFESVDSKSESICSVMPVPIFASVSNRSLSGLYTAESNPPNPNWVRLP